MDTQASFFLGTNSGDGFYSLFSDITKYDGTWRTYVIKGGPGTGKSGMMKKIADKATALNLYCERIWCSSDPSSLDAVVIPEKKVAICDGTAPHIVEPKFAGAVEQIINLGECWNKKDLELDSTKIMALTNENGFCHQKVSRLLGAIKEIKLDTESIFERYIDENKLDLFVKELINSIPKKETASSSYVSNRFITGLTPDGLVSFFGTIKSLCNNILVISDGDGVVASKIIEKIVEYTIDCGYNVILCHDLIFTEKIAHIIIPELSIAVSTSNFECNIKFNADKNVSVTRFLKRGLEAKHDKELEFNRDICNMLFSCASDTLKTAKNIHDELESYYIKQMNFEKVDLITKDLIKSIF